MKLYIHPLSSNARRTLLVANHLALPVETIFVDLTKGEQRAPEFLALNPGGKVPVLDDDGFVLTESWAIMGYLADKKPSDLFPAEVKARAKVQQWLFWMANHLSPQVATLNFENMLKAMFGMGPADPARVAHAEKEFKTCLALLDAHLANSKWVCGTTMTIADLAIAPSFSTAVPAKLPMAEFANVQRWFGAVRELPAWQATEPKMG